MLWLALFFPRLPLEVFARSLPAGLPAAVCTRLVVLEANEAARATGVHPGLKRATALALAPSLHVLERDPAREADALRQVACWALQFTPAVSLQPPVEALKPPPMPGASKAGLLLDVQHSLRLFGGRSALLARVRTGLAELGITARIGCAPTATGAWLLAQHRDGLVVDEVRLVPLLSRLPVSLLEHAQAHLATLGSVGACTLDDLLRLPRAGLARRFGAALLTELDQAFGRVPQPRAWFDAPLRFADRLELFAQVDSAQALLFAARRLILPLCGWLAARQVAVRELSFTAAHDDYPATPFSLRLADPSRDPDRITALLREQLAVTRLPAPAHTLSLECSDAVALADVTASLFPAPGTSHGEFSRLLERLQARLGREHVQRLRVAADHRPEAAWCAEPVNALTTARGTSAPPAAVGALPRPLWLLASPIAIDERNNRPYHHGPLALLAGPERIESGWWDGRLVQRDYFIASDEGDALLWIYRERVPDAQARHGWFIQGRFG